MEISKFYGNGAFFFSDPAGAKACLALSEILIKNGYPIDRIWLFSNKQYQFYGDWSAPVSITDNYDYIFSKRLDWVFTGTSHPESSCRYEVSLIEETAKRGIYTHSFIDHWTCMKLRFQTYNGSYCFPNEIMVVDEYARKLAIEDGIPSSKIKICTNPYLDYIKNYWVPLRSKSDILGKLRHPQGNIPFILFAPDPLSLREEDIHWGFNEGDALEVLITILSEFELPIYIKKHPLQPNLILDKIISKYSEFPIVQVLEVDNLELMYVSDLIIGFHSNFLLEARAMGKTTLRYQIGLKTKDTFANVKFGEAISSENQMRSIISRTLNMLGNQIM